MTVPRDLPRPLRDYSVYTYCRELNALASDADIAYEQDCSALHTAAAEDLVVWSDEDARWWLTPEGETMVRSLADGLIA